MVWFVREESFSESAEFEVSNHLSSLCSEISIWPLSSQLHPASGEKRSLMGQSDEAHFWLNGYANKQNCRIWSETNPQVYVETPLHPEKLTVWCALWAGGIILQKR
ncbi:putative transposable element [Trichonephila clavipes]|nr:putative transposable element [Trichonephila clavipes]